MRKLRGILSAATNKLVGEPDAFYKETEKRQDIYEVQLRVNGNGKDVSMSSFTPLTSAAGDAYVAGLSLAAAEVTGVDLC
jgi:hypothetical protein